MKKLDLDQVAEFIRAQTPETRIYLGCDSERVKVDGAWHADYVLAIVSISMVTTGVNCLVKCNVNVIMINEHHARHCD